MQRDGSRKVPFANSSKRAIEVWACDEPRRVVKGEEFTTVHVPKGCDKVSAELFGVLYEAPTGFKGKMQNLFSFVVGGSPEFMMQSRPVVCFENKSRQQMELTLPPRPGFPDGEKTTVSSSSDGDNTLCYAGLEVDVLVRGVSPSNGDVRGTASAPKSGLWVTSKHLKYDILS